MQLEFNFKFSRIFRKIEVLFVSSIAEFAILGNHNLDPFIEELIIIATPTIDEPAIGEVDPLVLSEVVSNIEHLYSTPTPQINEGFE